MEVTLQYPFTTAAGQPLASVSLRRLKVRDIKAINQQANSDPAQIELLGVARMAGLLPEDLEEMDAADYQTLKTRFLDILGIA